MDPKLITLLRADLQSASFTAETVRATLGAEADGARLRGVMLPAQRVLADTTGDARAVLIRCFLLGETLTEADLLCGFPTLGAGGARELQLVRETDTAGVPRDATNQLFSAALSLNPVEMADPISETPQHWWLLSDLDDQLRRGPAAANHVMGVGGATRSLIAQAPVDQVRHALDLGTGCGVVALHLALRGPVTATDISERALMLAQANALLNDVVGITFVRGDLFAPVTGQQFDLILSNPPFVVTPRTTQTTYEYRDAGVVGDALAERVITEAPSFLQPGGTLLCLANWESPWGTDGLERVRTWVDAGAARAALAPQQLASWVMERDRVSPLQYAETWARDGGARPGDAAFDEMLLQWLEDFSQRRVVAIGLGSIRMRRLAGDGEGHAFADAAVTRATDTVDAATARSPIRHSERATGAFGSRAGRFLAHTFDAALHAEHSSMSQILGTHWYKQAGVTEERVYEPGEDAPSSLTLLTEQGVARHVVADPLLSAAVGASDGDLTLGQIADALATLLEVDAAAASEALVAGFRELCWLGMLAPWPTPEQ